jgi:alpha-glucosidase
LISPINSASVVIPVVGRGYAVNFELREQPDGYDILIADRLVLCHRPVRPACALAQGDASIRMFRGNFAIEDSPSHHAELCHASLEGGADSCCHGRRRDPAADAKRDQHQGRRRLAFSCTDRAFDRLWIRLAAEPGEHVWGGGEQMSYLHSPAAAFPIWTSEPGVGPRQDNGTDAGRWTSRHGRRRLLDHQLPAADLSVRRAFTPATSTSSAYSFSISDPLSHRIEVWAGECQPAHLHGRSPCRSGPPPQPPFRPAAPLPEWRGGGAIIGSRMGRSFERLEAILEAGASVFGACGARIGRHPQTSFGRRLFWDWRWNAEALPRPARRMEALRRRGIRFLAM